MDKNNPIQQEIISRIDSGYVYTKLEEIANNYSLTLDQLGDIDLYTCKILLGEIKSASFENTIAEALEIDSDLANKIVGDINTKVISQIKSELAGANRQETPNKPVTPNKPLAPTPSMITPTTPITVLSQRPSTEDLIPKPIETNVKPVEKMGDFVVDITPKSTPLYKENSITKESVLKGIEDPEINMADHMLSAPTVNTAKVEEKIVQAKPPPVINKSYGTDPYRESI